MNNILKILIDSGAILEGHFLLTSGRHIINMLKNLG